MKKVNLAIDIISKDYVVPERDKIKDEDYINSLILRVDCDTVDEFVNIHKKMNEENISTQQS